MTKYEVIELRKIPFDQLEPHPKAELIPMDDEDRASLQNSLLSEGTIYQPLLVAEQQGSSGKWIILDGVNRWKEASDLLNRGGLLNLSKGIPCLLVRAADPGSVAAASLTAGRKRTTGQRVLIFLESHKTEVLEEARRHHGKIAVSSETANADKGQNSFTATSISDRLRCSKEDVLAGIELLKTLEEGLVPETSGGSNPEVAKKYISEARDKRLQILAGSTGIRTWSRAVGGSARTKGLNKADPDYRKLLPAALTTVKNGFLAWPNLKWEERGGDKEGEAKQAANLMFDAMPDVIRALLIQHILTVWPASDCNTIRKALVAQVKEQEKRNGGRRK